jgi:hypothetical protein
MNTRIDFARSRFLVGIVLMLLVVFAGCGGDDKQAQQPAPGGNAADANKDSHAGHDHAAPGGTIIAGVTVQVPGSWSDIGASGMRQAQLRMAPVEGDADAGEVNVFYFGPTSGGGVEANLTRWIGQITLEEGVDAATAVERSNFTADGMAGHVVALNGSYKTGGGRPMGGDGELMPGYRLVGVVIEGPEGSVFFKLTGPEATARAMEGDLLTMVKGAYK